MGGRGAKAGVGGGSARQQSNYSTAWSGRYGGNPQRGTTIGGTDLEANWTPGFDDNGNPQVIKLQSQNDEDKLARFMSKVNDDLTFRNGKYYDKNGNEVSDQFPFYDGEYQKFSLAMGLNAKPQVMPDKQFDAMVRQNGLQVLYRGESGQAAADRFMTSDLGHTGTGSYGDGYYFSTSKSTAIDYAQMKSGWNGTGKVETMVLSPTARAIRYSDLQKAYNSLSPRLQRALQKAGQSAKGASYDNSGEAQLALRLGYNVVAVDSWGGDYCYAIDRSAFIIRKTVETY